MIYHRAFGDDGPRFPVMYPLELCVGFHHLSVDRAGGRGSGDLVPNTCSVHHT